MGTIVQNSASGASPNEEKLAPDTMAPVSDEPSETLYFDWLQKTDRQFRFPHGAAKESATMQVAESNPAQARWLEANGVRTQFLDAGIGCCWFAEKGDEEPVIGETEYEAIARLAEKTGLELWTESHA